MTIFSRMLPKLNGLEFLSTKLNPVLRISQDSECVLRAIREYSYLPKVIVTLLGDGLFKMAGWPTVEADIRENIGDETGVRTGGLPHFEILKRGVQRELNLSIEDLTPSSETSAFVAKLRAGLIDGSRPFAAGVLWGLEATAIPELSVVATAINRLAEDTYGQRVIDFHAPPATKVENWKELALSQFFGLHIGVYEVDHRDGLSEAILNHLLASEEAELEAGVELVLTEMSAWWNHLAYA